MPPRAEQDVDVARVQEIEHAVGEDARGRERASATRARLLPVHDLVERVANVAQSVPSACGWKWISLDVHRAARRARSTRLRSRSIASLRRIEILPAALGQAERVGRRAQVRRRSGRSARARRSAPRAHVVLVLVEAPVHLGRC